MPDLTPNLNLKKPNWDTEAADIRVFNDNMDIIDEKITDANKTIQNLEEKKQNKEDISLKTIAKTIVGDINELFATKLDKGGYTGNAKNLNDEISKKASKTVLGRMIVGDNLTVDDNGRVSATKTEIVNDLTTGGADKALSGDMGKELNENKLNKTGGDVSGLLSIKSEPYSEIQFKSSASNNQGAVGAFVGADNTTSYVYLRNNQQAKTSKLSLYQNGYATLTASNLTTPQKEVIGAINDIYAGTQIYRRQLTGVVDFNTITEPGIYECRNLDKTSFKNANDKTPIVGFIHSWGCFEVIPFGSGNILQRFTPVSTTQCQTTITRVKYYDQPWGIWLATIHQNSKEFNSFIGIAGAVQFSFIQDEGVKNANSLYYDNATFALYRCKNRTEDVSVTDNFEKVSILDNLNKIKNLITTSDITSTQRVSTDNGLEWYFGVTNSNKVISAVLPDIKGCQLESYAIDKETNRIYVTSTSSPHAPESITIKVIYLNI